LTARTEPNYRRAITQADGDVRAGVLTDRPGDSELVSNLYDG
jgi:hypothetical protein